MLDVPETRQLVTVYLSLMHNSAEIKVESRRPCQATIDNSDGLTIDLHEKVEWVAIGQTATHIGVYLNPTDEEPIATLQLDQPAMSVSTVTLTPKKRTKGQNMAEEALGFSGSIVLKAKTAAEVKALAAQLDWYAAFEDPFHNRYDGGYAAKGKVRAVALEHAQQGDAGALATQVREQAAQIGLLEERAAELEHKHARAERDAAERKKILDQLTREEHWRLVCRSAGERGLIVVGPALGDAVVQQLARDMLERAARVLETDAPDNPLVSQRAADACAALVRSLAPNISTTPEEAARQAEQAAAIVARFQALFSPPKEDRYSEP